MRKTVPLLLLFLFTQTIFGQVGINTTTPDAQLDIRSANPAIPTNKDGLLVPKINLFPAINPTAAQNGMLVFLTAAVGANQPGFYYWDNPSASWKGIGNEGTKWGVAGNGGTSSTTNFIGTTDDQDIVFKRQNARAGLLNTSNTSFGVSAMTAANGGANTAFGALSLAAITSGAGNTAVGSQAIRNNTTGDENTALGFGALQFNSSGDENVAIGRSALGNAGSGAGNTSVGYQALSALVGAGAGGNIALGHRAGSNLLNGYGNILIGNSVNPPTNLSSFKLNIGNTLFGSIGTDKNIGINTQTPQGMLDVSSVTNGILIPRIALTAANVQAPVVNPQGGALAESTFIYNTATAGASPDNVMPGFYYWSGSRWLLIDADQAKNKWGLNGNAGTSAATHFIGTTDFVDLVFKRANMAAGRLGTDCTAFGLRAMNGNQSFASTAIGNLALFNTTAGAYGNTALGTETMISNTTGYHNTGLGRSALRTNTAGFQNTAVGGFAMDTTFGDNNTAVGYLSLSSNGGDEHTALGFFALPSGGGNGNTAVGAYANAVGSNATSVGNRALAEGDNTLVLGSVSGINGATASVNVGIGTTQPQSALEVADENVVTSGAGAGNLNVMTSSAGAIDTGGSLTLGGYRDTGASSFRVFGSVEGRKANAVSGSSNGYLLFKTNLNGTLTERLRITESGDIGIGIATPEAKLHLFDGESGTGPNGNSRLVLEDDDIVYQHFLTPAASESGLLFGTSAGSLRGGIVFNNTTVASGFQFRTGGNFTRMTLTGTGDLGIGTNAPGGQFELSLNEGRKPGSTTWTIPSDERLKTILGDYGKGLQEIVALRPITYRYADSGSRNFEQQILATEFAGFSAQEVQKIFPEAVGTDPDGYLNFNMHPILVASVNAIRELKEKNDQLTEANRKLQQQIDSHGKLLQDILDRLPPESR